MVFTATFKTMSVISLRSVLLVEETRVPGETTDLSQAIETFYHHNVVSSTPRHECGSNPQLLRFTDCTGSCKSNYYEIATTTPDRYEKAEKVFTWR